MCGISGIFHRDSISDTDIEYIHKFNAIQRHRGPDDTGIFHDRHCALGHNRLSIIDLSHAGHQPFFSEDRRYVLVFNGEIYNYIELRNLLEEKGYQFKTATDTEVLLTSFIHFGADCLKRLNGMFAFAVYDRIKKSLFLARDHVGIKPLYYTVKQDKLYFASELKALCTLPSFDRNLNYQSLFDFFVFNRTDVSEETFYSDIFRIPSGHYAFFAEGQLSLKQWWNPEDYLNDTAEFSLSYVAQTVQQIFLSALDLQMRSDVPVGTCLSGGLDSSILIGALFSKSKAAEGFPTFTASFPNHSIDETKYIRQLNSIYPFTSNITYPTAEKAYNGLKKFVYMNDEPTTNPSFFSQYMVMEAASKQNVTVLLDGQGGDESFAGYHYFHGFHLYGMLQQREYGQFWREMTKSLLRRQHISAYQTLLFQLLPDPIKKRMLLLTMPHIQPAFFHRFIETSKVYHGFFNAKGLNQSLVRHFQYKLEHLLRMEDRNSMSFSIEARVPYLDNRLIEFLLGVSPQLKIKNGETKFLQKKALGLYTTQAILSRKDKIGFGTPGQEWMQTSTWQKFTESNYDSLSESFPEIFIKKARLPKTGYDRWKINQFKVWNDLF